MPRRKRTERVDSWELEEPGFSLDDPIRSLIQLPFKLTEDSRGHSCNLSARYPKGFAHVVQKLQEGDPRYDTRSDVHRHAGVIGYTVIAIAQKNPEARALLDAAKVASAVAHRKWLLLQGNQVLDDAEEAIKVGDTAEISRLLRQYLGSLAKIVDGQIYVNCLRERARRRGLEHLLEDREAE